MNLLLRPFTRGDIETCRQWAMAIRFQQYQSRYAPRSFCAEHGAFSAELYCWYIIVVDGEDVGTVWLEKETLGDEVVVLGIMLGREDRMGRGIGSQAVCRAIRHARDRLNFRSVELHVRAENARAIACYRRCGFVKVGKGVKSGQDGTQVPFLTMRLGLEASSWQQK